MKNLIVSLIWIGFITCLAWFGSVDLTPPWIHPELEGTVDQWREDVDRADLTWKRAFNRLDSITIHESLPSHTNGYVDFAAKTVYLSKSRLDKDPIEIKATLYHELGHWVFLLEHGDCAMLRSTAHTRLEYYEHWDLILEEYLDACKNKQINALL